MRSKLPTPAAALVAAGLGSVLFLEVASLWHSTMLGSAVAVAGTGLLLWPVSDRSDDDRCAGCSHRRAEHHGICQACQREVVGGVAGAPAFACERFSAPTGSSIST